MITIVNLTGFAYSGCTIPILPRKSQPLRGQSLERDRISVRFEIIKRSGIVYFHYTFFSEEEIVKSFVYVQCAVDIANNEPGVVPIDENDRNSVIQNVLWQMNSNRKSPALKNLEGHMYRSGVEANKLKGQ